MSFLCIFRAAIRAPARGFSFEAGGGGGLGSDAETVLSPPFLAKSAFWSSDISSTAGAAGTGAGAGAGALKAAGAGGGAGAGGLALS